jgi:hypothetical protein
MNKGRVGEERGGKKIDRCPLTLLSLRLETALSMSVMSVSWI